MVDGMPEMPVPQKIRESVLRELYRQADSLGWEDVQLRQKTNYYRQWVEHPLIGGQLADYYTAEGMRVWLKDGPLKEYARALENFGPFAKYANKQLSSPSEFVAEVLGDSWTVVPGTIKEKPMHCMITDGHDHRYVCWGRPRTFRDLLWAAVNNAVASASRPLIVVYLTDGKTVSDSQKSLQQRIATHCALDLAYVRRRWNENPSR